MNDNTIKTIKTYKNKNMYINNKIHIQRNEKLKLILYKTDNKRFKKSENKKTG